ncbi:MAG: redoxin domain-containing protein [Planctomycetes bacterium]|nr:redoxin domain-containing protein [Planctomycetota bacterium]
MANRFLTVLIWAIFTASAGAQSVADKLGPNPTFEEIQALYEVYFQKWVDDMSAQASLEHPYWPTTPDVEFFPFFQSAAEDGVAEAMVWVLENHGEVELPGEEMRDLKIHCVNALHELPFEDGHFQTIINTIFFDWNPENSIPWAMADRILRQMDQRLPSDDDENHALVLYTRYSVQDSRMTSAADRFALLILERLAETYPHTRAGEIASGLIIDKRFLQVGMKAPIFNGNDVDGNPISLSDYRGKVTYLVFWGFW